MGVRIVDLTAATLFRVTSLEYYKENQVGTGARIDSGRFNRHGTSALYLSFDAETGLTEYYGGDPPTPAVILPFEVTAMDVVEIGQKLGNWPKIWRDCDADWRWARDQVAAGVPNVVCGSWECGQDALDRNCSGIMYPSTKRLGGKNLVLFMDDAAPGRINIKVLDPRGRF